MPTFWIVKAIDVIEHVSLAGGLATRSGDIYGVATRCPSVSLDRSDLGNLIRSSLTLSIGRMKAALPDRIRLHPGLATRIAALLISKPSQNST